MRFFLVLVVGLAVALSLSPILASAASKSVQHVLSQTFDVSPSPSTLLLHPLSSGPPSLSSSSIVQPSSIWATTVPLVPAYQDGRLYVLSVVAGVGVVLCLDPSTLSILRTYSLPETMVVQGLHTTSSDLFLLAVDISSLQYSILRMSIKTGEVQSSVDISSPHLFLGVDAAGQRLLTAVDLGYDVVLINATTGDTIGSYSGGVSPLHVMGGGLQPVSGNLLVVDRDNKSVLVISPDNDTVVSVLVLPVNVADFYSLSLSKDGVYAYVLIRLLDFYMIDQYEVSTGRFVNRSEINHFASQVTAITASDVEGEVWATDVERLTLDRLQSGHSGFVSSVIGPYPIMHYPSGLAVSPTGSSVYVSTNAPPVVHELNSAGHLLNSFPVIDVHLCGTSYPASTVSVDAKGNVFIPQCNSTLFIYDSNQTLLTSLYTGKNSRPRSCAPTLRDSVYITDDNQPAQIAELDVKTGQQLSVVHGATGASFFDVTVDPRNGSVWASDAAGMLVYHWASDSTLIGTFDVSSNNSVDVQSELLYGIAVDAVTSRVILAKSVTDTEGVTTSSLLWLDAQSGRVVDTYTLVTNGLAVAVAVSPNGSTVYATDHNSLAVLLFDHQQQQKAATVSARMD